jgi:hypothetical protein
MAATPDLILSLLHELEQGDPLDFGAMSLSEDAARQVVALSLAGFSERLAAEGIPAELREQLALATAARVVLDNLALHYQLLVATGAPATSAEDLLAGIAARFQPPGTAS